jgi:hypothetical protein
MKIRGVGKMVEYCSIWEDADQWQEDYDADMREWASILSEYEGEE